MLYITQRRRSPPIHPQSCILDTPPSPARSLKHTTQTNPHPAHTSMTLQHTLVHLDDDARMGQTWARNAGRALVLLVCFDLESRVLRIANTGLGHAFLGHRVSGTNNDCMELVGPNSPRYLNLNLVGEGVRHFLPLSQFALRVDAHALCLVFAVL